jgi:hypothetical protein
MLVLTIGSLIAGLVLSVAFRNFDWLARFGALVICWGILLLARPSIADLEIGVEVFPDEGDLHLDQPEYYLKRGEEVPWYATERSLSRRATGVYGPIVCFVGTLTNGFASLLNGAFGFVP